jgi:pantoate kinase
LSAPTSTTFNISAGAATKLVFSVQPVNTAVNTNITPAVKVAAVDGLGNIATSFTGSVVIAKEPGSPAGTLTGTLTRTAVAGVATFDDLKIGTANTGFRLRATATGLTLATSALFNITP